MTMTERWKCLIILSSLSFVICRSVKAKDPDEMILVHSNALIICSITSSGRRSQACSFYYSFCSDLPLVLFYVDLSGKIVRCARVRQSPGHTSIATVTLAPDPYQTNPTMRHHFFHLTVYYKFPAVVVQSLHRSRWWRG